MAQGTFTAQVSGMVNRTKQRMLAVRNESIQRTIDIAQTPVAKGGNMPVDTGFLRSSGVIVRGLALPVMRSDGPVQGQTYEWLAGQVTLVLAEVTLREPVTFAYTANYARTQEYRAGHRFVGLAAQRWPQTVSQVVRDLEARTVQ